MFFDIVSAQSHNVLTLLLVCLLFWPLGKMLVPRRTLEAQEPELDTDHRGFYPIFDALKGIAIVAVILIHVVWLWPSNVAPLFETFLNAFNAFLRFAIPVFFIVSGILLHPPKPTFESIGHFYYRKFVRLLVPYFLVSLGIALAYGMGAFEFVRGFITGSLSDPFYFIIILFQMYLIYPLIHDISKKRWFVYFSLVFSIVAQISPFSTILGVPTFFRFLFFFVWGIHMKEQLLNRGVDRSPVPWLAIVGLFGLLFFAFPGEYFNMRPFYGVAMFMLLYLVFTSTRVSRIMDVCITSWTGRFSLWIFLTHFPIMAWFVPAFASASSLPAWITFICASIVSVVGSIAVGYGSMRVYRAVSRFVPVLRERNGGM